MSGGGGSTTTQKADPWSGVQPYLTALYGGAHDAVNKTTPDVAQNSGVADFTPEAMQALQAILTRSQGSAGDQIAGNVAQGIAQGNDAISQNIANSARGQDWNDQYLAQIANGSDASTKALTNIAQGNDAASQSLSQVAGGNDVASQYLKSVLSGKYLTADSNPYLSGAVDAASADATRNFQTAVMPQLASQFSLAGRYGSGAQSQGVSDATNNLAKQLSNTAANIYNTNYQNERGLQQASAGTLGNLQTGAAQALGGLQAGAASSLGGLKNTALGTISNNMNTNQQLLSQRQIAGTGLLQGQNAIDWNNLNQGLNAASIIQQQAQNQLEGNNALYDANQQQRYNRLSWLSGILSGASGLNQTSTSTSGSGLKNAFGGALSGAAVGTAIAPGIGTGIGAAAGLLMGVL